MQPRGLGLQLVALSSLFVLFLLGGTTPSPAAGGLLGGTTPSPAADGQPAKFCDFIGTDSATISARSRRVVCADIAALDQILVYNRFGSFNPFGMIFALTRDVVSVDLSQAPDPGQPAPDAQLCDAQPKDKAAVQRLAPTTDFKKLNAGQVRLRDCKRPRPLVLRANAGDVLVLRVRNLLRPLPTVGSDPDEKSGQPDVGETFCRNKGWPQDGLRSAVRPAVSSGDGSSAESLVDHGEALCKTDSAATNPVGLPRNRPGLDWPHTRSLAFSIDGLVAVAGRFVHKDGSAEAEAEGRTANDALRACRGLRAIEPDATLDCQFEVDREGTYFLASDAAPAGGEGNGGSITHGLFGAVIAEQRHTRWYRSQVPSGVFDQAWTPERRGDDKVRHSRKGDLDYEAVDANDQPLLNIAVPRDDTPQSDFDRASRVEIINSDLNAIIFRPAGTYSPDRVQEKDRPGLAVHSAAMSDEGRTACAAGRAPKHQAEFCEVKFREFSVFFHDELKAFYTRNYEELGLFGQLAGVRDGFAINYGSSGLGTMILANRKNIGPAADCAECLYEEFFLTSWANGDPALLEQFSDDPSNVHHSYLNDPVTFRNFHAGPKETHVFHLHAHQWFAGNDQGRGTYLDSQTVGPRQGFTYDIYHGGLNTFAPGQQPSGKGWWESMGSGNRNRTIGDSIFHCHLYPHFAQGMWELWRVHDTLEDGTRKLPDGQERPGLSLEERELSGIKRRPGSVDPWSGQWVAADNGGAADTIGTPIPALVPLPNQPLPLLPTYAEGDPTSVAAVNERAKSPPADQQNLRAMPGYPFTLAGRPGHRPPQAPMDIARQRKPKLNEKSKVVLGDDGKPVLTDELTADYLDAGLPRHVLQDGAERKFGIGELPGELLQSGAAALPLPPPGGATPASDSPERKRERGWSQVVARMLAEGDLSSHLEKARLELLPYDGTALERAAMGFHFDGIAWPAVDQTNNAQSQSPIMLDLRKVDGSPSGRPLIGSYESIRSPALGSLLPATDLFAVNGAPPKPGAPFADPCGGTAGNGARPRTDPLVAGASFLERLTKFPFDIGLTGFRRFEVSAVQLDLVTNRAGWHDPQARIAVLTSDSDRFKDRKDIPKPLISPLTSASEEPFFFRALSGECVEFRHTNELPKELELDDFQVKTPTDTIGQHIHLVKFDVTSSDGSGNGFNYEDGTFAPDEVASRICAAESVVGGSIVENRPAGQLDLWRPAGLCENQSAPSKPVNTHWWRMERSANLGRFQTTVQRWFADPILADDGQGGKADRTMRTVFSHDHFGPSSIQQHGYYTALVIEPQGSKWTKPDGTDEEEAKTRVAGDFDLRNGTKADTGTRKRVIGAADQRIHPDFREFAIAIADFALLYDPRDRKQRSEIVPSENPDKNAWRVWIDREKRDAGMATLVCELVFRADPQSLKEVCGSAMKTAGDKWFADENVPPAWQAAGRPEDSHAGLYLPNVISPSDTSVADSLRNHLLSYRLAAAGYLPTESVGDGEKKYASPVAPPQRPESISVDHHDPYLVNYRGEPIPLRVGTKNKDGSASADCRLKPLAQQDRMTSDLEGIGALKDLDHCSVEYQRTDRPGDMASVFSSLQHFDPATPILETYSGERNIIRLIQGSQEVQHTFNIEGVTWRRNIDQTFPSMMRPWDSIWRGDWPQGVKAWATLHQTCQEFGAAREGRPREYAQWATRGWQSFPDNSPEQIFWRAYTHRVAECDNQEGIVTAQEVGISEHFEFGGAARGGLNSGFLRDAAPAIAGANLGQATKPGGRLGSGDYLYDFGSQDALWNGAWGLLRVYFGPEKSGPIEKLRKDPDTTACLLAKDVAGATPLGFGNLCDRTGTARTSLSARLKPLSPKPDDTVKTVNFRNEPPETADAVACPADARHVYALAVARNDADRRYSNALTDKDGLQFTLIDPAAVFTDAASRGQFMAKFSPPADDDSPGAADRKHLGAELNLPPPSTTPFVLRVRAGDCVHLAVVNALEMKEGTAEAPFLSDALGDARMPPIVPLNVDPAWSETTRENCKAGDAACRNQPVIWTADLTSADIARHKRLLRPSASLSLRLPILTLTPNDRLAVPFGINRNEPLQTQFAALNDPQAEFITFYAGRGAVPELDEEEKKQAAEEAIAALLAEQKLAIPADVRLAPTSRKDASVIVDGRRAYAFIPEMSEETAIAFLSEATQAKELSPGEARLARNAVRSLIGSTGRRSPTPDPLSKLDPAAVRRFNQNQVVAKDVQDALEENNPAAAQTFNTRSRTRDAHALSRLRTITVTKADALNQRLGRNGQPSIVNTGRQGCALVNPAGGQGSTQAVDTVATCIPYAFGALPIKSFGDVIGHGSHGLLGALVVEPSNWHPQAGDHEFHAIGHRAIQVAVKARVDELKRQGLNGTGEQSQTAAEMQAQAEAEMQAQAEAEIGAAPFLIAPGPEPREPQEGVYPGTAFSAVFEGGTHRVREHVVFWRDGMNLWDSASKDKWRAKNAAAATDGLPAQGGPVANCHICDDSYDFGEKGVNYQSAPFHIRLRAEGQTMNNALESHYDLNAFEFPTLFYLNRGKGNEEGEGNKPAMPILRAEVDEEVIIRVLHPSGRARQRAFVTTALDYDDLFPGFGFPHAALLAPGKGVTASIARPVREGCYVWKDGPTPLRAGGTWGLLDVVAKGRIDDASAFNCRRGAPSRRQ